MDEIDYKRTMKRIEQRYPSVVRELVPVPVLSDFSRMHDVRKHLSRVTRGMSSTEFVKYFIAVAIKLYDPMHFDFSGVETLPKGLVTAMGRELGLQKGSVIYRHRSIDNDLKLYPEFRQAVDWYYNEVARSLSEAV